MWPFGGAKKPTELRSQKRKEQIAELLKYNPSIVTLSESMYELAVNTRFGQLKCQIEIGPEFPEKGPEIRLTSSVSHPWVNPEMHVVGHPKLGSQWSVHHNLGQLVRDIYYEFCRNPPTPYNPASQPAPTPPPGASLPSGSATVGPPQTVVNDRSSSSEYPFDTRRSASSLPSVHSLPPAQSPVQTPQHPPVPVPQKEEVIVKTPEPPIPAQFPELERLSVKELESLLNNPDLIQTMAETRESSTKLRAQYDDLLVGVENLALKNLHRKAEIQEWEAKLSSLRSEVDRQQAELAVLDQKQMALEDKYSLSTTLQNLDEAVAAADDECDRLKKSFETGASEDGDSAPLDANQFATKFLKARMLYHKRAAKRERLYDVFVQGPALGRSPSVPMVF